MWGAVGLAAAAWAAVVVTARWEEAGVERRVPPAVVAPVEPRSAATKSAAAPPVEQRDIEDRPGVPWGPDWSAGEVPTDELDRGDATLRLRLVGDTDGEPVEMDVRLWRLGVAESATWTAGDEIRASLRVAREGEFAVGLPQGRYRLQCLDLRGDAEDPPEFILKDGVNEPVLRVANRRWVRHRLALFDETGALVTRSTREHGPGGGRSGGASKHTPSWANPRCAKTGTEIWPRSWSSYSDGIGDGPGEPVQADDGGYFDLGRHQERNVRSRSDWSYVFRADARGAVQLRADDAITADSTFVGVAPRLAALVASVRHPDGTKVDPTTASIDATSDAIRHAWDPPADAWRSVPVRVTVTCDRYETLTFDWTAATADAPRVLVPKSPK